MNKNQLMVSVYSSGTTPINDPAGDLARIENVRFSTGYPGGLYLNASMFVPREKVRSWQIKGMQRFVIRNGLTPVFEGQMIGGFGSWRENDQGVELKLIGYWGSLLKSRRMRKRWADRRLDMNTWIYNEGASGAAKCFDDRLSRIRLTPKAEAWNSGEIAAIEYSMPTGETIKRVQLNYDMQEAAQAWELRLRDTIGSADIWSVTASGTGARDDTLGTPRQTLQLQLIARANQTPPSDGTIYGEITSVIVSSETGAIDLTEITKDMQTELSGLVSADTTEIDSNTYSLEPFIADRWETIAEILSRAASFGDASFNEWAVGLLASELSTDDLPLLYCEQHLALTDYDYAVRIDEENVVPPLEISRDWDTLHNWIVVEYQDDDFRTQYITPDDDANLTDSDSTTDWGQRDHLLRAGHATKGAATNLGRRYLAAHKDPQWHMKRPISVRGYIRAKNGNRIPSSEIRAGKRIKIENFLEDLSGTGLTFLVTMTEYSDRSEINRLHTGVPNPLAIYLAQKELVDDRLLTYER